MQKSLAANNGARDWWPLSSSGDVLMMDMQHLREVAYNFAVPDGLLRAVAMCMLLPCDSETAAGCLSLLLPIRADLGKPSADWHLQQRTSLL